MIKTIEGIPLQHQVVLLRCDFNVPMDGQKVRDNSRIIAHKATVQALLAGGAKVVLLSHMGRPKGKEEDKSLEMLLGALRHAYDVKIVWLGNALDSSTKIKIHSLQKGEVGLLENLRFYEGEEKGNKSFAGELANLGDIFVNDAFSVCHRAHASVSGIAEFLPSYGGLSLAKEVAALSGILDGEGKTMAVVGGSKVSTKLEVLEGLLLKVDVLAVVGAMAHTFLLQRGCNLGLSLVEPDLSAAAAQIESKAKALGVEWIVASDVVLENRNGETRMGAVESIKDDERALDVGEQTLNVLRAKAKGVEKVIWNGPLGFFEDPRFIDGTKQFAEIFSSVTARGGLTLAGGGDTLAAMKLCGIDYQNHEKVSYASTAGGAFLEWLEGKELPGIKVLKGRK